MIGRFFSVLALACLAGNPLWACACCASDGERFEIVGPLEEAFYGDLEDLTAFGPAEFVTGECGTDCVDGVEDAQYEYQPDFRVQGNRVTIRLSDIGGTARGTLFFELPEIMIYYGVDTNPEFESNGPLLYKELIFDGGIEGTGDFAALVPGTTAKLVLAGRSNHCSDAGDLETWSIDVDSEGINFRIFGRLAVG